MPIVAEEITQFRKLILETSKPKTLKGEILTGANLAGLLTLCIEYINSGWVPIITDTWDNMQRDINEKSFIKAK